MLTDLFLEVKTVEELQDSACYFPIQNGCYEVKPGMMPLSRNFGNQADSKLFQLDSNFHRYRQVKLAARKSCLSKYSQVCNYSNSVDKAVAQLIINRLTQEYPQYFNLVDDGEDLVFQCRLTKETLYLNKNFELQKYESASEINCGVKRSRSVSVSVACPKDIRDSSTVSRAIGNRPTLLDALATQVQSDIVVISRNEHGDNWMSAIHLCYPNHWAAEEKIGKDFATVHTPVAGIEKINQRSKAIVNTMIERKPMVRFAWGLSTDTRLNHHPQPPNNLALKEWHGRNFDKTNPKLFLRIERQVIWGLPEYDAAIFTIRTYFRDCRIIKKDAVLKNKLISAIESMTPDSLIYKGLQKSKDDILTWLSSNQ
ncbi:heme-dependent oxidative N-demethylase family protein [Calothrix sp. CCY 0018]|uniref:heme-dependent oxidative N-demethylase family protein n=1 Tax=Calothrix sp. CCY 0018 TaxID=3103864 RepID=UPI0039C608D2